jgi:hypothetical protein
MNRLMILGAVAIALACASRNVLAQPAAEAQPSPKWEILDNSFLVEEAFNQERGVVQNIFTWSRDHDRAWGASFTQEWPAPAMRHQLSYTVPFSSTGSARGFGDVLVNYRYQLREETASGAAVSPRASLILPTGRDADGLGSGTVGLQVNVPVSKQFGDFYVHANAGHTWLPDVMNSTQLGGSGIWRMKPMINLMLEGVVAFGDAVVVSPGVRGGWNFGDRQLVVGAAIPLTRAEGRTTAALLTYLSYELPFRR